MFDLKEVLGEKVLCKSLEASYDKEKVLTVQYVILLMIASVLDTSQKD